MIFIDTNILVRYLTGLPPDQAAIAADIIDTEAELWITVTSLAEAYFIMSRVADIPRVEVVRALIDFMQRENIFPYAVNKDYLTRGLEMTLPSGRVSVGDALIWATVRTAGGGAIYSFDQRFPDEGIRVLRSS